MSTLRTELPWDDIKTEIIHAIDTCNDQRPFVSVKKIAMHICENKTNYPVIFTRLDNGNTNRVLQARVSMGLHKTPLGMEWVEFAGVACKGRRSRVFVDPRYRL